MHRKVWISNDLFPSFKLFFSHTEISSNIWHLSDSFSTVATDDERKKIN